MSKQITPHALVHIFCRLLLDKNQFDGLNKFESFMTEAATLVTSHCGGTVSHAASTLEDTTYVSIIANESLPGDDGIWKDYDVQGDLHNRDGFEESVDQKHLLSMDTYVICRNGESSEAPSIDTMLQVFFPALINEEFDDYLNCSEWLHLMHLASFSQ